MMQMLPKPAEKLVQVAAVGLASGVGVAAPVLQVIQPTDSGRAQIAEQRQFLGVAQNVINGDCGHDGAGSQIQHDPTMFPTALRTG